MGVRNVPANRGGGACLDSRPHAAAGVAQADQLSGHCENRNRGCKMARKSEGRWLRTARGGHSNEVPRSVLKPRLRLYARECGEFVLVSMATQGSIWHSQISL